ncbi:MAG: HupE/UreJ family protein, partial [Caulobacterales bacterium]|nr:HupE/UreJ family protein [Caulobacterales bacterium]
MLQLNRHAAHFVLYVAMATADATIAARSADTIGARGSARRLDREGDEVKVGNPRAWLAGLAALVLGTWLAAPAEAHRTGESYIYLNVTDESLSGRFEITLEHLGAFMDLDADGNGAVTKSEFEARRDAVFAALAERLIFHGADGPHAVTPAGDVAYLDLDFGTFAAIGFDIASLRPTPEAIDIEYRFLFDGPVPNHRVYVLIESNTRTNLAGNEGHPSLIYGPGQERQTLSLVGAPWHEVFTAFIAHGAWHIWIGYDHILFLVSLLLPSVMVLRQRRWEPGAEFRASFWYVVKVVTLFTVAHSVTRSLSALGVVQLPITVVEAIIAL